MRRLSLLTFLFSVSILSSGFTNVFQKPKDGEIKGIVCGTNLFMDVLIGNFPREAIFSYEAEDAIYDQFYNVHKMNIFINISLMSKQASYMFQTSLLLINI